MNKLCKGIREVLTIQFRVLDSLFESAWMQYATSALGRTTDVAEKISAAKIQENNETSHKTNLT